MAISTQDFTTLVRNQVAAIQGAASRLVDLTVGSILRSVVEANASVALWLQGLILTLLSATRASTSTGNDLDTWMADYGVTRLPAVAASGNVTFSRFTTTNQVVVPIGGQVQTTDGTQTYTVQVDTSNAAYNATLGGYVIAAGVGSVAVPVLANVAGAAGNAQAGQINTITQAMPGVDTVINPSTFTNGSDAESDASLRSRFVQYVASLSKATKNAVAYAITSLQIGVSYTLVENATYAGAAQLGFFYVVVDDGSGTPPSSFTNAVTNAIDAVRPVTSTFSVYSPVIVTANVAATVTVAAGYDATATKATVKAAIQAYINGLGLGNSLAYTRLAQVAYDASPGVTNVSGLTLNSGTTDVTATNKQVIKSGTVTVS